MNLNPINGLLYTERPLAARSWVYEMTYDGVSYYINSAGARVCVVYK